MKTNALPLAVHRALTLLVLIFITAINALGDEVKIDGIIYESEESYHFAYVYGADSTIRNANIARSITYRGEEKVVEYISSRAFKNCTSLRSIYIPNTIESVSYNVFDGCTSLKTVIIEDGTNEIRMQSKLFMDCELDSLYLGRKPSYSYSFGNPELSPFYKTPQINILRIGPLVQEMPEDLFFKVHGNKMYIDASQSPNALTFRPDSRPSYIKELWLNRRISIYEYLNSRFEDLQTLHLGESLAAIPEVFEKSESLEGIYCSRPTPPGITSTSFPESIFDNCTVIVPDAAFERYKAEWGQHFKHIVSVGRLTAQEFDIKTPGSLLNMIDISQVETVGSLKLTGKLNGTDILTINKMRNLRHLDISEASIVAGGLNYYEDDNKRFGTKDNTVGQWWLYNLRFIETVKLPESLVKIGDESFLNLTYLKEIIIPDKVESIGKSAFRGCNSMTDITIGASVMEIEYDVFYNCTSLTAVRSNSLEHWLQISFKTNPTEYAKKLILNGELLSGELRIPDYVDHVNPIAFIGCKDITSLIIPGHVLEIGKKAFSGCGIERMVIEDSETELFIDGKECLNFSNAPIESLYLGRDLYYKKRDEDKAPPFVSYTYTSPFYSNQSLKQLEISNNVTYIENSLFEGCTNLNDVIFPNSIHAIGSAAFKECASLTKVSLPYALTHIAGETFAKCVRLAEVNIPGGVRSINDDAFANCNALRNINVINPIPPVITSTVFSEDAKKNAVLRVPEQSKNQYWIHPYWSQFEHIEIFDSSSNLTFSVDGIEYHVTSDEGCIVEVSGLSNTDIENLAIPAEVEYDGVKYFVNGIANNSLQYTGIKSVEFSESLSYIGMNAFLGCANLESIISNPTVPPAADILSFDDQIYSSAVLSYPKDRRDPIQPYERHSVWGLFINRKPFAGIGNVISDYDSDIVNDSHVEVFNLSGTRIASSTANLPTGIYILRQGNKVRKVLVR